ncbi:hypothetical protein AVEN_83868-1 [Araneus ventricosus]|uniref:DUF4817 domain-containing protein n=1 Tax=Araneus ventricosus TaxID=182803 RepID=A0A4Y2MKH5_ARAVE|nr:hypothetical protein AVEN_83868-1 [Araneus ventricosus]
MATVQQKTRMARLWLRESKSIVTVQNFIRLEYRNRRSPSVEVPWTHIKAHFRKRMMESWQKEWEEVQTGRLIFNNNNSIYPTSRHDPAREVEKEKFFSLATANLGSLP